MENEKEKGGNVSILDGRGAAQRRFFCKTLETEMFFFTQ
jgi:hypothetical protein